MIWSRNTPTHRFEVHGLYNGEGGIWLVPIRSTHDTTPLDCVIGKWSPSYRVWLEDPPRVPRDVAVALSRWLGHLSKRAA